MSIKLTVGLILIVLLLATQAAKDREQELQIVLPEIGVFGSDINSRIPEYSILQATISIDVIGHELS